MKKTVATIAALFAFAFTAQAQDTTAPTLTVTSPANGVESESSRITISGEVSDDVGVTRVEYRVEGSRRWRKAILLEENATTTTWVVRAKVRRKRGSRIYFRAYDLEKNESDITGRKFRRSR